MTEPLDETTRVVVRVARALERAGVEYVVGGSVASGAHGEPRATRDIDFAVRLTPESLDREVRAQLTPDADGVRIISSRRATRRERKAYEEG